MYQPNFLPVPFHLGLYPIVDRVGWIRRLHQAGVRTFQLRIKNKCDNEIETAIATATTVSHRYNMRLFINDYWHLAIKYQSWGVHLGQEDLKTADLDAIRKARLRLGISTHNDAEIDIALAARPSYIALGHVFSTKTKQMSSSPQGLRKLASCVKRLKDYPTVAIGGINLKRTMRVMETGVGSIAVISAITQAKDWKIATTQLLKLVGAGDE